MVSYTYLSKFCYYCNIITISECRNNDILHPISYKIFCCKYNNMCYHVFPNKEESIRLNDFLMGSIKEVSKCENNCIIP